MISPQAMYEKPLGHHDLERGEPAGALAEGVAMSETVGPLQVDQDDGVSSIIIEHTWPRNWRAYICLTGCFFLMFNSWGLVNAYGTFASYYKDHLLAGHDVLQLNLVGSTECFVVLLLSAIVGRVLDAGHIRQLTGCGTVLVMLGLFLLSVVNKDGHAGDGEYGLIWLTQGFLLGLGMACFFVTSSQVVATWFIRRKSFAIGIVASGASISGLVYPIMTKYLIAHVGFNHAVRYVATTAGATSIFAFVAVQPNPEHYFRKPAQGWMKMSVWIDAHAFLNRAFTWYMASICFLFLGFYAVFFNLEEWAAAKGFGHRDISPMDIIISNEIPKDSIRTFWLLSIMNACSTFGRLSSAYLSDHYGALNVHMCITYIATILLLVMWVLTSTLKAAIAFVVLFGMASGSVIALPPAAISNILGPSRMAQGKLGQWTGMTYSASAVFALVGPVIAGRLISAFKTYLTVQLWAGFSLFASATCMAISRYYLGKQAKSEDTHKVESSDVSRAPTLGRDD